ncbi:MAG: response regulator [Bacteroidota bacterium]
MSQKRILVIEDNLDVRENIEEILELSNYEVSTAENGKIGVIKAKKELPDLILCDIMMPEMDGYEVLYLLSKSAETAKIPFIFLTAKAEKSDLRKGMGMGADDYLTKPFDDMELLEAIENRIKKYEALQLNSNHGSKLEQLMSTASKLENFESLADEKITKKYAKKEHIYREGDFTNNAYYILKGKIRLYKINEDGKELTLNVLKEGDFLGHISLIKEQDQIDNAEAMEDCECLLIRRDKFMDLILRNRDLAGQFIKLLSGNLIDKEQEMIDLAYNTVRKRTADVLVKLTEKYHPEPNEDLVVTISRDDLASMVGTATESVIRMLSEFKKDGILRIDGSKIEVIDYEGLKMIKF